MQQRLVSCMCLTQAEEQCSSARQGGVVMEQVWKSNNCLQANFCSVLKSLLKRGNLDCVPSNLARQCPKWFPSSNPLAHAFAPPISKYQSHNTGSPPLNYTSPKICPEYIRRPVQNSSTDMAHFSCVDSVYFYYGCCKYCKSFFSSPERCSDLLDLL